MGLNIILCISAMLFIRPLVIFSGYLYLDYQLKFQPQKFQYISSITPVYKFSLILQEFFIFLFAITYLITFIYYLLFFYYFCLLLLLFTITDHNSAMYCKNVLTFKSQKRGKLVRLIIAIRDISMSFLMVTWNVRIMLMFADEVTSGHRHRFFFFFLLLLLIVEICVLCCLTVMYLKIGWNTIFQNC